MTVFTGRRCLKRQIKIDNRFVELFLHLFCQKINYSDDKIEYLVQNLRQLTARKSDLTVKYLLNLKLTLTYIAQTNITFEMNATIDCRLILLTR